MSKKNKKKDCAGKPLTCEGNATTLKDNGCQVHGAYEFQAITGPAPHKGSKEDGEIPLNQVMEAREFIEENQK